MSEENGVIILQVVGKEIVWQSRVHSVLAEGLNSVFSTLIKQFTTNNSNHDAVQRHSPWTGTQAGSSKHQLSWDQKAPCMISNEGGHQQSYPPVMPINHSTNNFEQ